MSEPSRFYGCDNADLALDSFTELTVLPDGTYEIRYVIFETAPQTEEDDG